MAEPERHTCPECGTPREPDNTPACACARRAADALRDTRTAQAAAAEDFGPLRIRPYVELDTVTTPRPCGDPPPRGLQPPGGGLPPTGFPGAPAPPPGGTGPRPSEAADTTGPRPHDGGGEGGQPARPRRRRRALLLAAAGSVVTVAAVAGYASGMLSYDTPTRDSALPSGPRASVPDGPADTATPSTGTAPSASRAPASPGRSGDTGASPSPGPTGPSASASPARQSAAPSAEFSTAATGTGTPPPGPEDDGATAAAVLRRGDRGPEVAELQLRLKELHLYPGSANGRFTEHVEYALLSFQWSRGVDTDEDERGVYGPDSRRALESETREP